MTDKLVCPECNHENEPDAKVCANCKAVLAGNTTLRKADPPPERMPSRKLVCPECNYENERDATLCANCEAVLIGNTTLWKADPLSEGITRPRPGRPDGEFESGTLYLYMVGAENAEPVRFRGKGALTLGRMNSNGPNPPNLLDLIPYHAFTLGVSRQHARINQNESGYTVEDLNSSNGTRLNGNRLEPGRGYALRSGDQLQLGELLIFIYFS